MTKLDRILKKNEYKNINEVKQAIQQWALEECIDELENLMALHTRTYEQKVTDHMGNEYVNESYSFISRYETQERIAELRKAIENE